MCSRVTFHQPSNSLCKDGGDDLLGSLACVRLRLNLRWGPLIPPAPGSLRWPFGPFWAGRGGGHQAPPAFAFCAAPCVLFGGEPVTFAVARGGFVAVRDWEGCLFQETGFACGRYLQEQAVKIEQSAKKEKRNLCKAVSCCEVPRAEGPGKGDQLCQPRCWGRGASGMLATWSKPLGSTLPLIRARLPSLWVLTPGAAL